MINKITLVVCVSVFLLISCLQKKENKQEPVENNNNLYLLVGTYTSGTSTGIYVYRFNAGNGEIAYASDITNISNPSYLAVSGNEKYVYSVSENDEKEALANAFSFNKKDGTLKLINSQPTNSGAPCYITVDKTGQFVVTANYSGGNITVFPTNEDGSLLPAAQHIEFEELYPEPKSHLHCVVFSPDGKYLFANDLGKDKIYKFDISYPTDKKLFLQSGNPGAFDLEKGTGPRHLTFHPNRKYVYSIGELSGKVTVFQYIEGSLSPIQYIESDTITRNEKKGSADIHISPNGKFLYSSNRLRNDGITVFSINENDGTLKRTSYQSTGIHPRNFIISPNGRFLLVANRDSNNIQIFEINQQTGELKNTGKEIKLDKPVCLQFINENKVITKQ